MISCIFQPIFVNDFGDFLLEFFLFLIPVATLQQNFGNLTAGEEIRWGKSYREPIARAVLRSLWLFKIRKTNKKEAQGNSPQNPLESSAEC